MGTSKEMPGRSLRPDFETLAKEFPNLRKDTLGTGDLEVVDVNDEKDSEIWVEKARWPVGNLNEPALKTMRVAMLFPIRA